MSDKENFSKEELSEFAIKNEESQLQFEDLNIISSTDDIDKFDFTGDEELNINESYELIKHVKKPSMTKEAIQNQEADNIIRDNAKKYLEESYVDDLNKDNNNLRSMLKKYDVNGEIIKNMSEEDKDKIYGIAEYLFNNFQMKLNKMNFLFDMDKREWKFIVNTLNKIEFDQNEIFQLKELKEHWLDNIFEIEKSLDRNIEFIPSMINVNDVIVLYHLISKYKVKGMREEFQAYLSVLTKIGERIKLFNAYNIWIQRLSNDFQSWGGSLTVDEETVKGEVKLPNNDDGVINMNQNEN
jgi:hypothetical protein